jgi:hypothetical protein
MQPESKRPGVEVHCARQVSVQEIKILYKFIKFLIFDDDSITVLLSENMLDFLLRIDQFHNKIGVFGYSSGPDDGLALLFEVAEKVTQIFAFINAQQRIIRVELFVEIVGSHGGQEVAFLIGGECVHEKLVHFHDYGELTVVFFGREESLLGLVSFEDVFDDGSEVIFGLEFLFEEFEVGLFLFPEGLFNEDAD